MRDLIILLHHDRRPVDLCVHLLSPELFWDLSRIDELPHFLILLGLEHVDLLSGGLVQHFLHDLKRKREERGGVQHEHFVETPAEEEIRRLEDHAQRTEGKVEHGFLLQVHEHDPVLDMVFFEAVLTDDLSVGDETPDEQCALQFGQFDTVGLDHVYWSILLVSST